MRRIRSEDGFSIAPRCDVPWRGSSPALTADSYESDLVVEGELELEPAEGLFVAGDGAASAEDFALLDPSPLAENLLSELPSDLLSGVLSDLLSAPLAGADFFPDLA